MHASEAAVRSRLARANISGLTQALANALYPAVKDFLFDDSPVSLDVRIAGLLQLVAGAMLAAENKELGEEAIVKRVRAMWAACEMVGDNG